MYAPAWNRNRGRRADLQVVKTAESQEIQARKPLLPEIHARGKLQVSPSGFAYSILAIWTDLVGGKVDFFGDSYTETKTCSETNFPNL